MKNHKKPYRDLNLGDVERVHIMDLWCDFLASVPIKVINVVINKSVIVKRDYQVLDSALTYLIQRLENDLDRVDPPSHFIVITDEGRVGKMRKTARKLQRINYIPTRQTAFRPKEFYRREIRLLLEDPLPKNSKESYFIQASDFVSYIVYLHQLHSLAAGVFANRLPNLITPEKIQNWLERLLPSLNTEASAESVFGIVCYPKKNSP